MARSFNGSGDVIDLGQPTSLDFTGNFTISIKVNASAFPAAGANYAVAFSKGWDGAKEQYIFRFSGNSSTSGNGNWIECFQYNGSQHGIEYSHSLSTGTWYTITTGFDGSAWFLYVDAASVGSAAGTQIAPEHANANVMLGGEASVGRYFNGSLAEAAAWNAALDASEAAALARGYSPALIRSSNLVEYQPLVRENVSRKLAAPTVTGTAVQPHPLVIYPKRKQTGRMTTLLPQIFSLNQISANFTRRIKTIGY